MMTTKCQWTRVVFFILGALSIAFLGCSGSGGGSSNNNSTSTPQPTLKVLPADYDFGIVTDGHSADTLDVTLENDGKADLNVSNIILSDTSNYKLDLNGGSNPCSSTPLTISSGSSCTATVDFTPTATDTFSADLNIQSNDPTSPNYDMSLLGSKQDIKSINVKINQIDACPRPAATVYVSVTDQGGYAVTGLDKSAFTLTEAGVNLAPTSAVHVNDTVTLSVALLMDYSRSITGEPDNVTDMQNAAIDFVDSLGANDEAEIIKYATTIEVSQQFTNDKTLLKDAIQSTPDVGIHTALYDAVVKAVNDISSRKKDRKAIIIITDGRDDDGSGNPISTNSLQDVITDANADGIPVFTIGLGAADVSILQQMADETGGTYSDAPTSDNLQTVYKQLADLLFTNQYILTYTSGLASTDSGDLVVKATYAAGISNSDTKSVLACP